MILEKSPDLSSIILECQAPALINTKMQSLNTVPKCSPAMVSVLELPLEIQSKHLNDAVMYPVLETTNQKNKFFHILVESLEKI